MIKTLPITKAREKLPDLVDRADRLLEEYVITVNGEAKAILMSVQEYDSWQETMAILSNPKIMKDIKQSEKEEAEGKLIPWEVAKKQLNLK